MSDLHKNYLGDFGHLLRDLALEAKAADKAAKRRDDEAFHSGQIMAYYTVVCLLISQAEAFELPIEDLHLEGLDPDRDLLGLGTSKF